MDFTLNGKRVRIDAPPLSRLLDVLREQCDLLGTKEGCGEGECGACTVLIDGDAVNSCLVPFAQVRGAEVETIEGCSGNEPLQEQFIRLGGAQCGICTPGFIMAAKTIPPAASDDEIRERLAGNICRCTGYSAIYRAVKQAQRTTRTKRSRAARGSGQR